MKYIDDKSEQITQPASKRQKGGRQRTNRPNVTSRPVKALHHAVGNQAVQAVHETDCPQANLEVSQPGDKYEREAKQVATEVMQMPEPESELSTNTDEIQRQPITTPKSTAGRYPENDCLPSSTVDMCTRCLRRYRADKPFNCVECAQTLENTGLKPSIRRSVDGEADQSTPTNSDSNNTHERDGRQVIDEVKPLYSSSSLDSGREVASQTQLSPTMRVVHGDNEHQIPLIQRRGQRLSKATRSFFEPRFGVGFSDVRIHTSQKANESTRLLNARAFTVGRHIVFRNGAYRPNSTTGKRLLAHELTHVVQQSGSRVSRVSTSSRIIMPYRPRGSANFGAADKPPDMVEKPFESKENDPWIQQITVNFNGTKITGTTETARGEEAQEVVPTGKLTAEYYPNSVKSKWGTVTADVVGGKASEGFSNDTESSQGDHVVERIEGLGYHHTGILKGKRVQGHERALKYYKPKLAAKATMNYALFFIQGPHSGNQAIHYGPKAVGSKACVHVPNEYKMRQINYHSVKGETKVKIQYDSSIKDYICCARYTHENYMPSNPCRDVEPSDCFYDFIVDQNELPNTPR